jgi:hypothetical protein
MISGYDLTFMTFRRRPARFIGQSAYGAGEERRGPVRHCRPRRTTGRQPAQWRP